MEKDSMDEKIAQFKEIARTELEVWLASRNTRAMTGVTRLLDESEEDIERTIKMFPESETASCSVCGHTCVLPHGLRHDLPSEVITDTYICTSCCKAASQIWQMNLARSLGPEIDIITAMLGRRLFAPEDDPSVN